MGTYKRLSDSTVNLSGASLLDLFETAGLAALRMEYDTSLIGFEREVAVVASGDSLEALMESWLDQLAQARQGSGLVIGDVIVVEVGRPPIQRYGDTSLMCRGAVRGRTLGDWFDPPDRELTGAQPGSAKILEHKRRFEASVTLRWADRL